MALSLIVPCDLSPFSLVQADPKMVNSLCISRCRGYVKLYSEVGRKVSYRSYKLSSLPLFDGNSGCLGSDHPLLLLADIASDVRDFSWTTGSNELNNAIDGAFPSVNWTAEPWWPKFGDMPGKIARITVYDTQRQGRGQWVAVQHYSIQDDPAEYSCCCRPGLSKPTVCRFVVVMDRPRLAPEAAGTPTRPLVAVSANRIGWIDVTSTDGPCVYKFKMVAFPVPNRSQCPHFGVANPQPIVVDIPHDVLGEAQHILFEGAISVVRIIVSERMVRSKSVERKEKRKENILQT